MIKSVRKEMFRKSIHLCSAAVPLFLRAAYLPTLAALLAAAAFYTVSEILRMNGARVPVVSRVTEFAARERDENRFVAGPVTLVLGVAAAAAFFAHGPARIGIYALSFGDGLASLAGKLFGRVKIPLSNGKTVAGSLTCLAAVFVTSFAVCRNVGHAFVLALLSMLIEVLPLADFDNLIIPVAVAAAAQFVLKI